MERGFINRYDAVKGCGFITTADGEEVFFHKKDIEHGLFAVEFEMEDTDKGLKAKNVKRKTKKEKKDE